MLGLDESARRELRAVIDDSLDDGYVSSEVAAIIDQRIAEADANPGEFLTLDEDEREVRSRRRTARRTASARVDPIDPLGILVWREGAVPEHLARADHHGELRQGDPALQVILVGPRSVGLQVAAGIRAGAPEQDDAALSVQAYPVGRDVGVVLAQTPSRMR